MKKEFTSIVLSASLLLSSLSSSVIAAEDYEPEYQNAYTYNELLEMTDDEVIEIFGDEYVKYGFGDDTMEDSEKFDSCYPDLGSFSSKQRKLLESFREGSKIPYFKIKIDDNVELDYDITADHFGYPSDWQTEVYDAHIGGLYNEGSPPYYTIIHSYYIDVPPEIFEDFEKHVRFIYSYDSVRSLEEVESVIDMFDFYTLIPGTQPYTCGDANLDFQVNMADAVCIMQWISNPDKYPLSNAARTIGDVCGSDGLTIKDALQIQKFLLGLIDIDSLYAPAEN